MDDSFEILISPQDFLQLEAQNKQKDVKIQLLNKTIDQLTQKQKQMSEKYLQLQNEHIKLKIGQTHEDLNRLKRLKQSQYEVKQLHNKISQINIILSEKQDKICKIKQSKTYLQQNLGAVGQDLIKFMNKCQLLQQKVKNLMIKSNQNQQIKDLLSEEVKKQNIKIDSLNQYIADSKYKLKDSKDAIFEQSNIVCQNCTKIFQKLQKQRIKSKDFNGQITQITNNIEQRRHKIKQKKEQEQEQEQKYEERLYELSN